MDMKPSWIVGLLAAIALVAGAWYVMQPTSETGLFNTPGATDQGTETGQVQQQPLEDGAEGSIIGANLALGLSGNTKVGNYLIGYNGMAVYTKNGDSAATSTCYDTCAQNWPPYLVGPEDNVNQLKAGVTGKADTFIREDGTIQMTYNGKPLYFYVGDKTSTDVTGEGLGGVWHVAKP